MAELAVLIDRILAREAGVDQVLEQQQRVEVDRPADRDGGGAQPLGRAHPRPQRGRRGHDDTAGSARQRVHRPRAGRGHVEVRRELAIRIDLVRRAREHGLLHADVVPALERSEKEADVVDQRIDVAIGRDDDEDRAATGRRRDARAPARPA